MQQEGIKRNLVMGKDVMWERIWESEKENDVSSSHLGCQGGPGAER